MPVKTVKMLFGSGITKPTILALMRLCWKGAAEQWLPVFRVVTSDRDSLPSAFFVEFDPAFLDGVSKVFPDDLCEMLYYGIRDLSRVALDFAEAELMGDFQDWSPRAMEKMFLNRILSTQSPTGSAVARRIIYCPCADTPSLPFSMEQPRSCISCLLTGKTMQRTLFWAIFWFRNQGQNGCAQSVG